MTNTWSLFPVKGITPTIYLTSWHNYKLRGTACGSYCVEGGHDKEGGDIPTWCDLREINIVFYPHAQPTVDVGDKADIKTDFLKNKTWTEIICEVEAAIMNTAGAALSSPGVFYFSRRSQPSRNLPHKSSGIEMFCLTFMTYPSPEPSGLMLCRVFFFNWYPP